MAFAARIISLLDDNTAAPIPRELNVFATTVFAVTFVAFIFVAVSLPVTISKPLIIKLLAIIPLFTFKLPVTVMLPLRLEIDPRIADVLADI